MAVVGVGRVGLPVVRRLVAAGFGVRAFDVRAEPGAAVRSAGATWSPSQDEAVDGADMVLTVLPGSPELAAAVPGLLARLAAGTTWVDLTSTAPDVTSGLTRIADQHGVAHLDAGLGGGPAAVEQGAAVLYVGGETGTLDAVRPALSAFAERIEHMGPAGTGHLAKLLVNTLWFEQVVGVAEVLLAAQRAGLAPDRMRAVLLAGPAASAFIDSSLPALLRGDYLTSFGLERCVEELDAVARFCADHDVPADLLTRTADVHRRALEEFGPADGELLAAAYLERRAGVQLRGASTPSRAV